jgi:hypothetical protein
MKTLITLLTLIVFVVSAFAGTTTDQTVNEASHKGVLSYYGTVAFVDSGNGAIYYTQAFFIGNVNENNAYGAFVCSEAGTEDVNVFIEYSNEPDGAYIAGTTNSALDAVGTTTKYDTLNVIAGTADMQYKAFNWARLKFVAGQAINSTTLSWWVNINKPDGLDDEDVGQVQDYD